MHHKTLHSSKNYIRFKHERNEALERLLLKSKQRIADETRNIFTQVLTVVSQDYDLIVKHNNHKIVDHKIIGLFQSLLEVIFKEMLALRKKVYILSFSAEAESIRRGTGKQVSDNPPYEKILDAMKKEDSAGGSLAQRLSYTLTKIKNKVMDAIHLSLMQQDDRNDMINRVYKALPQAKKVSFRINLKKAPIREADVKRPLDFIFTNDETWQAIIEDYKTDYIPKYRSPEVSFPSIQGYPEYITKDEDALTFGWQIEQQITNDFVTLAREGAFDSGKTNGVTDFMWIAILDDRTCEDCCGRYGCADFDGKTLSEIEKMTNGETTAPPAHFNCRCDIAPITGEVPEIESNEKDFETWLNN